MVDSVYIVKSTPLRAFIGSFQHFEDILQTYWRCAWRNLMQKKYFLTNLQGFYLSHFFNALKICCRHIEDVHEEIWCRKNIFWLTVCRVEVSSKSYLLPSFIFDRGFVKLAGNEDNHKFLDKFDFGLDRIHFRVTRPWVTKNTIFDLVQSIALLVLIGSL